MTTDARPAFTLDDGSRPPLPASLWDDLAVATTATLSTVLIKRGLRQTHLTGVFPLASGKRVVGEAVTLRYLPAREDRSDPGLLANPEYPQRKVVELVGPGEVLVVDARGDLGGGILGGILALRMLRRGAAGIVTDGAVRDADDLATLEMPVFAAGRHPAQHTAVHLAADIGLPIACGGVLIIPGDVIVGDDDGVVVLPRAVAAEVAKEARAQEEMEAYVQRQIDGGAPIPGVYPPNAATRAAFAAETAARGGVADTARRLTPPA